MAPFVMPVIITWKTYPWIRVGLQSFRRHFPLTPILVVDNNLDEGDPSYEAKIADERKWLDVWCAFDPYHVFVKTPQSNKTHGLAMDFAANWCRNRGILWMLHFEPDCLISGVEWARSLIEATRQDIWMAGSCKRGYGPIHPCPSIWNVRKITASFAPRLRGSDAQHPLFPQLMDLAGMQAEHSKEVWEGWKETWDMAQKAWFDAAVEGKALFVEAKPDFCHFWGGSHFNLDPRSQGDPRVEAYL
jgi:hypothetical protein